LGSVRRQCGVTAPRRAKHRPPVRKSRIRFVDIHSVPPTWQSFENGAGTACEIDLYPLSRPRVAIIFIRVLPGVPNGPNVSPGQFYHSLRRKKILRE